MERAGVARGKTTAAHLGAFICFEDETGQALIPPRARTWAPVGARPTVRVRGTRGDGRVNVAGVVCYRPGDHPRLLYRLHVYHGRAGETKSFTWREYQSLIEQTHQQLHAPLVWCWDNLPVHLAAGLRAYTAAHSEWLHVVQLPPYAPELNPTEGIWSLVKRSMVNFAAPNLRSVTRIIKRRLKKIQYRPDLITGCLTETGLTLEPATSTSST